MRAEAKTAIKNRERGRASVPFLLVQREKIFNCRDSSGLESGSFRDIIN
ncbi:hypothetical protein [Azospirillum argentinense]